jgi:hypothetical protein
MAHAMEAISQLTDEELVFRLKRLVQADRALSAKLLVHIGELDERRLFLGRGYSSTFDCCGGCSLDRDQVAESASH